MAAVRISMDFDDAEVRAALGRMVGRLANPAPVLDEIGGRLVRSTIRRFELERGPDGMPWKPSRRAQEEGGQTLTDTARLRSSITHRVSGDAVEVGTNVIYGAIHQLGGQAGRGRSVTLPARPYLGVDAGDRRAILRLVRRALEGAAP